MGTSAVYGNLVRIYKNLGENRSSAAISFNNIAFVFEVQGNYEEAMIQESIGNPQEEPWRKQFDSSHDVRVRQNVKSKKITKQQ